MNDMLNELIYHYVANDNQICLKLINQILLIANSLNFHQMEIVDFEKIINLKILKIFVNQHMLNKKILNLNDLHIIKIIVESLKDEQLLYSLLISLF